MTSTRDICWLAGILEGEGCFYLGRQRGTIVPTIRVKMSDKDVIERISSVLREGLKSTSIYSYPDKSCMGTKQTWSTVLVGYRAAGWMMTLYPLMGQRRQMKIREILSEWRSKRSRGAFFLRRKKDDQRGQPSMILHKVGTPVGS